MRITSSNASSGASSSGASSSGASSSGASSSGASSSGASFAGASSAGASSAGASSAKAAPLPGLRARLRSLRAAGERREFSRLLEHLASTQPQALLRFCLPRAERADLALLAEQGDGLSLRPCFGQPGLTLTVRDPSAAQLLTGIASDLGPDLVRLVVTPGLGRELLLELLQALPAQNLASVRLDGNAIRCRQPRIKRGPGNVIHLRLQGDNRLLSALSTFPKLTDLRLCENRVGKEGAGLLGQMALRRLDLRSNPIGDAGALRLCAGAQQLQVLRAEGCGIGPAGVVALAQLPELVELDLSGNTIGMHGAVALSRAEGLRRLMLRGCDLEPAWLARLQQAPGLKLSGV